MSKWKPIASAPKDGSRLLLWSTEWIVDAPPDIGEWRASQTYEPGWYDWEGGLLDEQAYTHWMRCPDPPKQPLK